MRYLFIFFLALTGSALRAQELTPAEKAQLEQAGRELKQYQDPAYMSKLLDGQIREAKKNGATPAQIRELEQAKTEAINQLKADLAEADRQKQQPAPRPEKTDADPNEAMLAALKKRMAQPDTTPASLIYDVQLGHSPGLPAQFRFYTESKLPASEFPAFMLKKYGVTLRQTGAYDFDGQKTIRYEQLHAGYVVRLARFSIVVDTEGDVTRANGDLFEITGKTPPAKPATALLPALRIATRLPALTLVDANSAGEPPLPYAEAEPLVWTHPNLDPDNATPVLTQPFVVVRPGNSTTWYLNAQTGALVATETLTRNCRLVDKGPVAVAVNTYHAKKQRVGLNRQQLGDGTPIYFLADSLETPAIVVKARNSILPVNTNDTLLNDEVMRLRGDFDVLFGFRTASRYFKKLGLNSFDNAGSPVHAMAYNEANADWDSNRKRFRYGKDKNIPIATLQIMGHEFTHAVNTYANGLIYQGESGAIDESIADMFGTIIDHQTLNGNWLIGEEITPGGFRNIANPTAKGDADTYDAGLWKPTSTTYDEGNVHGNSGVGNRWFYLLVKGGKGQNALRKTYEVTTPVPYNLVARLLMRTLPRLTPSATYKDFCHETIATAEQLFGDCGYTQSVKQAWYAVGVLDDPPPLCTPGWTMEVVLKSGSEKIRYMLYVKSDSIVCVYKDPESIVKIFTRRNSAYTTSVVQDTDGLHSATLPKDYYSSYLANMNDELLPAQEVLMAEQLQQVRAALASPATRPEDRAQLKQTEAAIVAGQQQMKTTKAEMKANEQELADASKPVSEASFWQKQGGKRKFDKDYIKQTTLYQGKYLTRKYVLSAAMTWWSTPDIPLRLSDITQIIPLASFVAQNSGINYLIRGFPVNYLDMMQMQNIREDVPNSFDKLFSEAAVFQ